MKKTYNLLIAALLSISLLMATNESRCFAYGIASEIVNVAGANLDCTLTCDESYVCATATFVGGSGTVEATAIGYFRNLQYNKLTISSTYSNPTPGGVSTTVNCPAGSSFYAAEGVYAVDSSRGEGGTTLYVSLE